MSTFLGFISLVITVLGAIFTYYRFFREGPHNPRIELDIELVDLGFNGKDRIVECAVIARNNGNVEHRPDGIRIKVRGLKEGDVLQSMEGHAPRLAFTEEIEKFSLVDESSPKYFIRPGVTQRFPAVIKIPSSWSQILIRTTFKYPDCKDIHTAERGFRIKTTCNYHKAGT